MDEADSTRTVLLATDLADCTNPLPGMTCQQLALPLGSTYASAAARVLAMVQPRETLVLSDYASRVDSGLACLGAEPPAWRPNPS